nr:probable Peptidase S1C [uncultured bacterium]
MTRSISDIEAVLQKFEEERQWADAMQLAMKKSFSVMPTSKNVMGSGFMIRHGNYNYVVTNKHVVDGLASATPGTPFIVRRFVTDMLDNISDSRDIEDINTTLVGKHATYDVAVLQYAETSTFPASRFHGLPYFDFYQSTLSIGQNMFVIGSGQAHELSVLPGIVANIGSFDSLYPNAIFTTARTQPGNSGGGATALEYNNTSDIVASIIGILTWGYSGNDYSTDSTGVPGYGLVQPLAIVTQAISDIFAEGL